MSDEVAILQVETFGDEVHPIASWFVERFEAGGENKIVGGPRAGDIQHAFALFEFFAPFKSGEESHASSDFFVVVVGWLRHERAEIGVERGGGCTKQWLAV